MSTSTPSQRLHSLLEKWSNLSRWTCLFDFYEVWKKEREGIALFRSGYHRDTKKAEEFKKENGCEQLASEALAGAERNMKLAEECERRAKTYRRASLDDKPGFY